MNEFFAADPASCENSADLRFLLGHFGPLTGRYLAEYPVTWAEEIEKHCAQLGSVEAERLKLLVRRAREKSALLRDAALPWNTGFGWIKNYRDLVRQRPSVFAAAVLARSAKIDGFPSIDDLDLSPTADELIEGSAQEYARVSKMLLRISPELHFIDPYLNPCKKDRRDVLIELFAIATKGKCRKITCWASEGKVVGERSHSWEEVGEALNDILGQANWPTERVFRYVLVDDATARTKMHARYVLSIKGGIRFDQGFQRLPSGRRNEVSPIGEKPHEELIKTYHEGAHDMKVERVFEYGCAQ